MGNMMDSLSNMYNKLYTTNNVFLIREMVSTTNNVFLIREIVNIKMKEGSSVSAFTVKHFHL